MKGGALTCYWQLTKYISTSVELCMALMGWNAWVGFFQYHHDCHAISRMANCKSNKLETSGPLGWFCITSAKRRLGFVGSRLATTKTFCRRCECFVWSWAFTLCSKSSCHHSTGNRWKLPVSLSLVFSWLWHMIFDQKRNLAGAMLVYIPSLVYTL